MTVTDCLYFQIHSSSGQVTELAQSGPSIVIGRYSKTGGRLADVCVDDQYVSRRHCRLFRNPAAPDQWLLEDVGSNNGTRLDSVPVIEPVVVKAGAWIQMGTTRITFSVRPMYSQPAPDSDTTVLDRRDSFSAKQIPPVGKSAEPVVLVDTATDVTTFATKAGMPARPVDDDATLVRVPATHAQVDEADITVVRPADSDVTLVRVPATHAQVDEADATVVRPVDGDATLVRVPATHAQVDEADITVVRPVDGDATLVRVPATYPQVGETDATVVRPVDGDTTALRVPDAADVTVARSVDNDTTRFRTRTTTGATIDETRATVVRSSADGVAQVCLPNAESTAICATDDGATQLAPKAIVDEAKIAPSSDNVKRQHHSPNNGRVRSADDEVTRRRSFSPAGGESSWTPGDQAGGTEATEVSDDSLLRDEMSGSQAKHYWPSTVVSRLHRMDPLKISACAGMILRFIRVNYLDDVQAAQLLERAQRKGQTVFRTLVQDDAVQNILPEILADVAKEFNIPYIDSLEKLTAQVMETDWLPFNRAGDMGCVLLRTDSPEAGTIAYGALDPFDVTLYDWVKRSSQATPRCSLMHPEVFSSVMQSLKNTSGEQGEDVGISIDFSTQDEALIRDQVQDINVPQMVNYFLYRAHLQGASDIHIEPTEELLLVRLRVDGMLHQEISLPMIFHPETASRLKILSGMDVVEKRRPQDGRLAVVIRNNPIDVRVSSYPTVFGEKFVLRLLDKNALRPSIETLGLMERDRRLLREKLAAPYGLVMISGPTGSGKTTTLYSCLGGMDRDKKNVLTIEDPVEYRMAGIHQMQVNEKIKLTFASGLRTILRQDPDVIMVGETRDSETAAMAIQASLTGHIVFSTIHTNDAVGVITRLLDMKIEPFLVSTALSLAVAQRLVRTICKHCRVSTTGRAVLDQLQKDGISKQRLEFLGIVIEPDLSYAKGDGCSFCRGTGYHGRRAVFELFEMTDEARNMIMSGDINATKLKELSKKKGMTTLIKHGVQLVEDEVTTFEEVLRVLGEDS